ncbi:MAG: hypothetical protein Q7R86_01095 [bacterium]|nr:hypothetical protein [bacterium]
MTNETSQPHLLSRGKQTIFIIIIFLVIIAALIVAWVVFSDKGTDNQDSSNQAGSEGSLGADIAEKAQNPLSDKLPETNPGAAVNPIEGAYQNPFGD